MIPSAPAKLLEGKKGLIVGIANDQSIAWGCAKAFRALRRRAGGDLSQRQGQEISSSRWRANSKRRSSCRSTSARPGRWRRCSSASRRNGASSISSCTPSPFRRRRRCRAASSTWSGTASSPPWTCRAGRFIRMAHLAEPLMRNGGTLFTMTYYGSQMVVKNYNIMGVAKAALESAVRYIAAELGPKGIRVHAISPGPLRDPRGLRHPGVRRAARQGKGQSAGAQPGQHRRRRRRDRVPRARCGAPHHRRNALRRRRLPHHRLGTCRSSGRCHRARHK